VILSQVLDVVEIPDLVGAFIVLNREGFVVESIVKVFDEGSLVSSYLPLSVMYECM